MLLHNYTMGLNSYLCSCNIGSKLILSFYQQGDLLVNMHLKHLQENDNSLGTELALFMVGTRFLSLLHVKLFYGI